jgi:hypothetical protein
VAKEGLIYLVNTAAAVEATAVEKLFLEIFITLN